MVPLIPIANNIFDPVLWERYGLAGLFGLGLVVLLFYVLRTLIPKLFQEFSAELANEREHAANQMAEEREHCTANHKEQLTAILKFQEDNRKEHETTRDHTVQHIRDFLTLLHHRPIDPADEKS